MKPIESKYYKDHKNTCCKILIAFIIYAGMFYFTSQNIASASGSGTHTHTKQAVTAEKVIISLETQPASIEAGYPATLLFSVRDKMGNPVKDLTITHERLLHVVIISEDLNIFSHIHPEDFGTVNAEMMNSAGFPVKYVFPEAGQYLISVDSAAGEMHISEQFLVSVTGKSGMGTLKKDLSSEKKFGDYDVKFSSSDKHIIAGKETTLKYNIKINNEPVIDLKPYLSAPMHMAIVSTDLKNFMHAHGGLPGAPSGHMHASVPDKFGPDIEAHIVFPAKGTYQIFGEVKHKGKVIVTSFMVEVE